METLSKVLRGALATSAMLCLVTLGSSAQDQSREASSASGSQSSSASSNTGQSSSDQASPTKISDQDSSAKSSKKASSSKSDQAAASESSSSGKLSAMDKQFVTKAAQGGMAEVELGQLASQNAESQEVKDFGQRMVTDHSKANDQLKQLAEQKGVTLATDLPAKEKATKDKLSKLKGEQFDRAYMKHMVMDHQKDVAEFKKASTSAKDPDVKNFASQTLPTLEDHLKEAQKVSKTEQSESHKAASESKKVKADTTASTPKQ
jgi:putative membrane protein